MPDYQKACGAADQASEKAKKSGAGEDHRAAMRAHREAASAAFASGNAVQGKMHSKKSKKHRQKIGGSTAQESPLARWVDKQAR
jgi:hypothetical protein